MFLWHKHAMQAIGDWWLRFFSWLQAKAPLHLNLFGEYFQFIGILVKYWDNTTSESALDETKTPYSLSHIRLKSKQSLEIWDNLSSHLLALGCFSFEMEKYGRTVFVWKQHLYVNVVFKQTWIYPFIAKSLLLVQPTPFGRQNPITRKWEEQMKQLIVENWCSWRTATKCVFRITRPLP